MKKKKLRKTIKIRQNSRGRFSHGFFQLLQMVVGCSVNFLAYRYKTDGEHDGGELVMVVMMMVVMVMMVMMMDHGRHNIKLGWMRC